MVKGILWFALLGSPGYVFAAELTSGRYTVVQSWPQEQDYERSYWVNVPRKARKDALPVFIFLHGSGGDGYRAQKIWLQRPALASHFIMVFPDGYANSWNVVAERSKANDLAFIETIVQKLAAF